MQQKASFEQRYSTTQRDLGEANGTIQSLNEENLVMTRQLGQARTGISNLRNRLDEMSIQVAGLDLNVLLRQENRGQHHRVEHCGS